MTLILTGRDDEQTGQDVYAIQYADLDAFINSPPGAPGLFSGINVSSGYTVGGFDIYNNKPYLLLTGRSDEATGQDVYIIEYADYDAFINSPPGAAGLFSGINVSSGYTVGGFSIYNDKPYLLLTGRNDEATGQDVYIIEYADYDAFINSPPGAIGQFSGINVSSGYTVGGFDIYNDKPYLLLAGRNDEATGQDAYLIEYADYDAFINSPPGAIGMFSGINVSSGYRVGGISIGDSVTVPSPSVPEIETWLMLLVGFFGTAAAMRSARPRKDFRPVFN